MKLYILSILSIISVGALQLGGRGDMPPPPHLKYRGPPMYWSPPPHFYHTIILIG